MVWGANGRDVQVIFFIFYRRCILACTTNAHRTQWPDRYSNRWILKLLYILKKVKKKLPTLKYFPNGMLCYLWIASLHFNVLCVLCVFIIIIIILLLSSLASGCWRSPMIILLFHLCAYVAKGNIWEWSMGLS